MAEFRQCETKHAELTISGLSHSLPDARDGCVGSNETHALTSGSAATTTSSVARSATSTPGGSDVDPDTDADADAACRGRVGDDGDAESELRLELMGLEPDEARAHTLYTQGMPPISCSIVTPATRTGPDSNASSARAFSEEEASGASRVSYSSSFEWSGGSSSRVKFALNAWQVTDPRASSVVPAHIASHQIVYITLTVRVVREQYCRLLFEYIDSAIGIDSLSECN